jgi:hypothetical protein
LFSVDSARVIRTVCLLYGSPSSVLVVSEFAMLEAIASMRLRWAVSPPPIVRMTLDKIPDI